MEKGITGLVFRFFGQGGNILLNLAWFVYFTVGPYRAEKPADLGILRLIAGPYQEPAHNSQA